MADYLHGAYGEIQSVGSRVADDSLSAIVYVGTAPVHNVEGGSFNVNKPVLVHNIAEARAYFGYSDEYDKYTLCEAMRVHLEHKGIGPLVLINVLDPATHRAQDATTVSKTPANGQVVIASAQDAILDTLVVTGKTKGTDYTLSYNIDKKTLTIKEVTAGSLGTSALTITYNTIDPTAVTNANVIGSSSDGLNTGLYAVKNVYQATEHIPAYILCPGFSSVPAVHSVMVEIASKINGHWDAYLFVDLPLMNGATQLTMDTIKAYKDANGYNNVNETVFFPMAEGVDGKKYHISVLAAANFQELLFAQDSVPYKTASNTPSDLIANLYLGASYAGRVWDDETINEKLNKNGIASAAYVGGRWVVWGCHSADYDQSNADRMNVSETSRMMLYYISNDFQHRRVWDVDKPMSRNDLNTIIAEEQTRIDALLSTGALTYGRVYLNAQAEARSDIMQGDYSFIFDISTTPLAKSLTAIVNWTDQGFVTYYENVVNYSTSTSAGFGPSY